MSHADRFRRDRAPTAPNANSASEPGSGTPAAIGTPDVVSYFHLLKHGLDQQLDVTAIDHSIAIHISKGLVDIATSRRIA